VEKVVFSLRGLPILFQRSKMAKVELRALGLIHPHFQPGRLASDQLIQWLAARVTHQQAGECFQYLAIT
jgi:hypothetical protein